MPSRSPALHAKLLALSTAALLCASACSHLPVGNWSPQQDAEVATRDEAEAISLERKLDQASASATPPSCPSACKLAGEICILKFQICELSKHHDGRLGLAAKCTTAEARCARVRAKLFPTCSCPDPAEKAVP